MDARGFAFWARKARIRDLEAQMRALLGRCMSREGFGILCDELRGLMEGLTPKEIYWRRIEENRAALRAEVGLA